MDLRDDRDAEDDTQVTVPLKTAAFQNEDAEDSDITDLHGGYDQDIDSSGVVTARGPRPEDKKSTSFSLSSSFARETPTAASQSGTHFPSVSPQAHKRPYAKPTNPIEIAFYRLWQRLPPSWFCERDPGVAFKSVTLLLGFLALCVFVFALPSVLHRVAPTAIAPPGTAPTLDSAASLVFGEHGAVAADNGQCSRLGIKVLRDLGGNAIDAMVSTVLCEGVLSPFASGLGGGGFILVHFAGNETFPSNTSVIDAQVRAPSEIDPKSFQDNRSASIFGGLAVAVPGELRGLEVTHKLWGRLPWKDLVDPVAAVAEEATVSALLARRIALMNMTILASPTLTALFTKSSGANSAKSAPSHSTDPPSANVDQEKRSSAESAVELPGVMRAAVEDPKGGKEELGIEPADIPLTSSNETESLQVNQTKLELLREGDKLVNPVLAQTLRQIAAGGADVLYNNWADALAEEVVGAGGVFTANDFKSYYPVFRVPIVSFYHGLKIVGAPPPSSGGACISMALNILEGLEFRRRGRNGPTYRMFVEALKYVFAARMRLGDPDYVRSVPGVVRKMLSKQDAMTLRAEIEFESEKTHDPSFYIKDGIVRSIAGDGGTTHVSIIDSDGNAVAVSSSINLPFGAAFTSGKGGFIYNNGMDMFATRSGVEDGIPISSQNSVKPGKRPLSSLSPTIIMHNDVPFLVIGGSGGSRVISSTLQTILSIVDWGDSLADAISAPRLHHSLIPNIVSMESVLPETCELYRALSRPSGPLPGGSWSYWPSVCRSLKAASHNVTGPVLDGAVHAVQSLTGERRVDGELGKRRVFGASDPRTVGLAEAY